MLGRGPPAYNAKPTADGGLAHGFTPDLVHRAMDEATTVSDGQPGWQAPVGVNGPVGPVAHRQMDGPVAASNGLMAHRGLV